MNQAEEVWRESSTQEVADQSQDIVEVAKKEAQGLIQMVHQEATMISM
jgi:hypothetical protein